MLAAADHVDLARLTAAFDRIHPAGVTLVRSADADEPTPSGMIHKGLSDG